MWYLAAIIYVLAHRGTRHFSPKLARRDWFVPLLLPVQVAVIGVVPLAPIQRCSPLLYCFSRPALPSSRAASMKWVAGRFPHALCLPPLAGLLAGSVSLSAWLLLTLSQGVFDCGGAG